jgi:hypothetical protein
LRLETAIACAKALSPYDLIWYQGPGDPLDFELQATLRQTYKDPMATREDMFQPYGGFPGGVKVDNSTITLPELPGIGCLGRRQAGPLRLLRRKAHRPIPPRRNRPRLAGSGTGVAMKPWEKLPGPAPVVV